jgi:hypothetical protein
MLFCLQNSTNQFIPKDKGAMMTVFTTQVILAKYWKLLREVRRDSYNV